MRNFIHKIILTIVTMGLIVLVVGCIQGTYTISFEEGPHNQVFEDVVLSSNDPVTLPEIEHFILDGKVHQFLYWSYKGVRFSNDKMPSRNIKLVAVYDIYTGILFKTTPSSIKLEPLKATEGSRINAPNKVPIITGFVFSGWVKDNKPFIFDRMPNESIILTANYLFVDNHYNQLTTLPKMFINLEDNYNLGDVDRYNYINAQITITSDTFTLSSATAEFKGRGNGSWFGSGPKKGYRIKFDKRESLFGIASNRHWVILAGANFYDTTLLRNSVAFNLANNVFSNIEYTSSAHHVEIYVNGLYQGVYLLAEHVRVDDNRVNIQSEFGMLDTGYLIEYDAYGEAEGEAGVAYFRVNGYKYPFVMKSPDFEDYLEAGITLEQYKAQVNFIKNYVTTAFSAALSKDLTTFESYVDIDSFIDMYLLHELLKNTDTGWSSFFMYKKPGGKLYAGPAWDFDASMGKNRGDQTPYGYYVSNQVMQSSDFTASELYINLMQIPEFRFMVLTRWARVSVAYKTYINNFLSTTFINQNRLAFGINFYRWSNQDPSYGYYSTINNAMSIWASDVNALRNWMLQRADWFDNEASSYL